MNYRNPGYYFCETWRVNFWFYIGWPADKFKRHIKRRFNHDTDTEDCDGKCIEFIGPSAVAEVIWVRNKKEIPYIAHECLHAANLALDRKGWKYDPDNHEPQTYLLQALMREALKYARRK